VTKVLMIEYESCVGCRTCEMACSAAHSGAVNPFESRITVIKWDMEGEGVPIACSHCESAPCLAICPVAAISRDESLGRVMVDHDKCIGCRMCVTVCPFGAIRFDTNSSEIIKCDVCDGDPLCVRFCSYGALQYVEVSEQTLARRRDAAERVKDAMATGRLHDS
jgi:carbon-monoxide dehydrogenase iron sulfur subunit